MELTEELVCRSAQQYDIGLVHDAHLASCHLEYIGKSLQRCAFLTRLDLHQNQLSSLDGVEGVGSTLLFLNVAENELVNIQALQFCVALQTLYLEGNRLATVQAIEPLRGLRNLNEVVFQRRVPFEGEKNGFLLLDNPLCQVAAEYQRVAESLLYHVRWVDGAMFRGRIQGGEIPSRNESNNMSNASGADVSKENPSGVSYKQVRELLDYPIPSSPMEDPDVKVCLARLYDLSADMAVLTDGEKRFQATAQMELENPTEYPTAKS